MPNLLQFETSPYLLQHANNPVHWQAWGDAAFDQAKTENKPVLVSIGYAACHWCHVMEHESFEDPQVAEFMNEHFINIKVDREEHPDVDHFYMDALQSMTGAGGWPLNMFVTPDRKPFYGGTYFPPEQRYGRASWLDILIALQKAWVEKPEEIERQGQQMLQHLEQASQIGNVANNEYQIDTASIVKIAENILTQADTKEGGFGAAPKFPATGAINFLLDFAHYQPNVALGLDAKKQAILSLDKMIGGGIYDQIGGGFARYATDNEWLVPHFEKMLYDNALLLSTLCTAFKITRDSSYQAVITETIAFCNRELTDGNLPGYYCALDADSEGVEGLFYTWTWEQWQTVLPNVHPAVPAYFGVEEKGNWEHTNILHKAMSDADICEQFKLDAATWKNIKTEATLTLFQNRASRIRPTTDDKILLSWNALMNSALTEAGTTFPNSNYLETAITQMDWLLSTFKKTDGGLWHTYKNGVAKIEGKLDDYCYLISALIKLGAASGDTSYYLAARDFQKYADLHFINNSRTFYYYSSVQQTDIPARKIEVYDGATPSANAIAMENLWHLGNIFENHNWLEQATAMMYSMKQSALRYPTSFGYWATFLQRFNKGLHQMVVAGSDCFSIRNDWSKIHRPEWMTMYLKQEEKEIPALAFKFQVDKALQIYLCEYGACKAPVSRLQDVEGFL